MTTAVLDAIRDRETKARTTALDTIAEAAKAAAAGKEVDAVAAALATLDQTSTDFERAVAKARNRAEWLNSMSKLPAAKSKLSKTQATLDAEADRFIAVRDAWAERATALEADLRAADAVIREGDSARDRLLDPANVLGGLGVRYAAAVKAARDAQIAAGAAEAALREAEAQIARHADWIRETAKQEPEDIDPAEWKARDGAPEWHRDGHHGELERYHRQWRNAVRDRDAARRDLADKSKSQATAKKTLDSMTQEVLKP